MKMVFFRFFQWIIAFNDKLSGEKNILIETGYDIRFSRGDIMGEFYMFPYSEIEKGKRVVIYGAGKIGQEYIAQLRENKYCPISFVIDENAEKKSEIYGIEIKKPSILSKRTDYDVIVLATMMEAFRNEMLKNLKDMHIDEAKVVWKITPVIQKDVSYSQHGEDRIIYYAFLHMGFFKDGKMPSYIDVGAHHPYNLSNTALFYQMGCRGINIEANPELIEDFRIERPEDINLCFGIGGKEGTFPFYISDVAGLNTFKKENLKYNEFLVEKDTGEKREYPVRQIIDLPIHTLDYVLGKYCAGIWPDFMSMDIEGMEFESLQNCNLTKGPLLLAVEVNYDGDLFVEMMEKKGYFVYLWYRENILFVRKDMERMVHAHTRR